MTESYDDVVCKVRKLLNDWLVEHELLIDNKDAAGVISMVYRPNPRRVYRITAATARKMISDPKKPSYKTIERFLSGKGVDLDVLSAIAKIVGHSISVTLKNDKDVIVTPASPYGEIPRNFIYKGKRRVKNPYRKRKYKY